MCGRPRAECQDVNTQEDWVAGDPIRCHATTAALARQNRFNENDNPQMAALSWPVRKIKREEE